MKNTLVSLFTATLMTALAPARAANPDNETADARARIAPGNPHLEVRSDFGNLQRMAAREKRVHVAFLGGSITQNTGGHTALVPRWLERRFPETEFTFTNAGLSSTCSTSGAFRLESHLFGRGPVDLLVVEFAVNDDQDAAHARRECIRGMEGIVRRVRRHNPRAEIVMVHYVNPEMLEKVQRGEGPVAIAAHEKVAEHYGITSVNVAAEVADAIGGERYTWMDYGGTHPKPFGYEVASNMMIAALERGLATGPDGSGDFVNYALPGPIDAGSYDKGVFVSADQAAPRSGGWKIGKAGKELIPAGAIREQYLECEVLRADAPGETLSLEFSGRAVGAFLLAGPDAGIVETSIDGGAFSKHDLFHRFSTKLNYPRSVIFSSGLASGDHRLELRVSDEKNPASTGNAVSILFFEINE